MAYETLKPTKEELAAAVSRGKEMSTAAAEEGQDRTKNDAEGRRTAWRRKIDPKEAERRAAGPDGDLRGQLQEILRRRKTGRR